MTTIKEGDELARLIERLRKAAETASEVHRMMAEAKSLRQEGNPERRADLYSWPKPEETLEWQAADAIETLRSQHNGATQLREENTRLRQALADLANNFNVAGSQYDRAITAVEEMVREVKQAARAALSTSSPSGGMDKQ